MMQYVFIMACFTDTLRMVLEKTKIYLKEILVLLLAGFTRAHIYANVKEKPNDIEKKKSCFLNN